MRRLVLTLAITGCSSPNTCDQNTVAGITSIADNLNFEARQQSTANTVEMSFTCAGGGSGTLRIVGTDLWDGTFTFSACSRPAFGTEGSLTLTGNLHVRGDAVNDVWYGDTDSLAIHGLEVHGCDGPVDETCAASWEPGDWNDNPYGGYDHARGTLCGRAFP